MNPLQESGSIRGSGKPKSVELQDLPLKAPPTSRLSVRGQLFYYLKGGTPLTVPFGFSRNQDVDEQAFGPRIIKVTNQWIKLDTGWIKASSGLLLISDEGRKHQVIPTPEEREESRRRVVEICLLPVRAMDLLQTYAKQPPSPSEPRDMHSPPKEPQPVQTEPELQPLLYLPPGETSGPVYPANVHGIYLRCPVLDQDQFVKVAAVVIPGQ